MTLYIRWEKHCHSGMWAWFLRPSDCQCGILLSSVQTWEWRNKHPEWIQQQCQHTAIIALHHFFAGLALIGHHNAPNKKSMFQNLSRGPCHWHLQMCTCNGQSENAVKPVFCISEIISIFYLEGWNLIKVLLYLRRFGSSRKVLHFIFDLCIWLSQVLIFISENGNVSVICYFIS